MKTKPNRDYVILEPEPEKTVGGLHVPDTAQHDFHGARNLVPRTAMACVREVGPGRRVGEYPDPGEREPGERERVVDERVPLDVRPGDRVLYERAAALPFGDEGLVIVREPSIWAVCSPEVEFFHGDG